MNASDTYRQYQDARDAAWRTLLRFSVRSLPVDVFRIVRELGISVHPYPPPGNEPALALARRLPGHPVCRALLLGRAWHVYFLSPLDDRRQRFALAHELGHIILGHDRIILHPGARAFRSGENLGDLIEAPQDMSDYAADIFAIRLLAPACVLHELRVDQPGAIGSLCGLPPNAAALRGERMELLNARNAFFRHPLEGQVRDLFLPFIRSYGREERAIASPALSLPPPDPGPQVAPPRMPAPETPAAPPQRPSPSRGNLFMIAGLLLAAILLLVIRYA